MPPTGQLMEIGDFRGRCFPAWLAAYPGRLPRPVKQPGSCCCSVAALGRAPVASALVSRISVVGVPSSAASYAAGQDLAPAALRSAGLLEQLIASGLEVHDDGDLPHQVWSPDRDHPLAQNAGQATDVRCSS